jgi:hypothetical protein
VVAYHVEPKEAWTTGVPNRWRVLRGSCFDVGAEKAGVKYTFTDLEVQSWSERPAPRNPYERKR